jgi:hypothetical protein
MTDTSTELYDRFVAYLRAFAVGSTHAQTAVTICHALALEPTEDSRRQLRACAQQASRCGVLLCSGQKGYYLPVSPGDAMASPRRLRSQAYEMIRRAKAEEELIASHFELRDEPDPEPVRPPMFAMLEATA